MANAVLMPQAGISVESCVITEWRKHPGDAVAEGDILFEYETDKAMFECESTAAGTLLEIFFQNGDEVPVLTAVCAVGEPGEDVSSLRPGAASEADGPEAAPAMPPQAEAAPDRGESHEDGSAGRCKASPRAKRLAAERHVDLQLAAPSGPNGRIIERDVRALLDRGVRAAEPVDSRPVGMEGPQSAPSLQAVPASPAEGESAGYEDVKFSGIRRAISASMGASLREIPQLTHNFSFDASAILGYRKMLKEGGEAAGLSGITLGDMILFAVSRLLPRYPDLNAHMLDDRTIRRFTDVHLAFACDTPRGLIVPVIRNANHKSLLAISKEVKALAEAALSGAISPDHLSGGSFTVSNLGSFGVESFTPVINPPQTGILGVDCIVDRPRRTKEGGIELYPAMGLSLTYDHRAIDGAPASRFVGELCRMLERFPLLLAE